MRIPMNSCRSSSRRTSISRSIRLVRRRRRKERKSRLMLLRIRTNLNMKKIASLMQYQIQLKREMIQMILGQISESVMQRHLACKLQTISNMKIEDVEVEETEAQEEEIEEEEIMKVVVVEATITMKDQAEEALTIMKEATVEDITIRKEAAEEGIIIKKEDSVEDIIIKKEDPVEGITTTKVEEVITEVAEVVMGIIKLTLAHSLRVAIMKNSKVTVAEEEVVVEVVDVAQIKKQRTYELLPSLVALG